jgi:hypothetical protein
MLLLSLLKNEMSRIITIKTGAGRGHLIPSLGLEMREMST